MYLFDQGFKQYELTKVLRQGALSGLQEKKYTNHVYIKNDFAIPLTKDEKKQVMLKVELDRSAKLVDGEKVGKTIVYINEEKVGERNLFYSKRKLVATTGVYWNDVIEIFSHMLGVGTDG